MYFYTKVIFILIIFASYSVTYILARTKSVRALQKISVISLSFLLILAVLFQETVMQKLALFLGVGRGPDAVLYLFIALSLSINFLLAKKLVNLEDDIRKIVQNISFQEFKK